jgi:hypothetical protein
MPVSSFFSSLLSTAPGLTIFRHRLPGGRRHPRHLRVHRTGLEPPSHPRAMNPAPTNTTKDPVPLGDPCLAWGTGTAPSTQLPQSVTRRVYGMALLLIRLYTFLLFYFSGAYFSGMVAAHPILPWFSVSWYLLQCFPGHGVGALHDGPAGEGGRAQHPFIFGDGRLCCGFFFWMTRAGGFEFFWAEMSGPACACAE